MVKFGTSGLRGLATELSDQLVFSYVDAFLSYAGTSGRILIGRDLRDSSPRILKATAAACAANGVTPVDCGVLPTPALAMAAMQEGTAAVMITGSHIPGDRNGLKFYTSAGEITKQDEARIEAARRDAPDTLPDAALKPGGEAGEDYARRYEAFYRDRPLAGLRVGIYEHSSVARDLLPRIVSSAGGVPVRLGRSATFVPVDTEAVGSEMRSLLAGWAAEFGLDAIISTDGDADRPMLADAEGKIIGGDVIGPIVAASLNATTVVTPVSSNTVVELVGQFEVSRCRIGSPYVIEEMERISAAGREGVVGYEANGGFLLGFEARRNGAGLQPLMTRDAVLPLLEYLAEARRRGVGASELAASLPARHTASDRLQEVPQEVSAIIVGEMLDGRFWPLSPEHGEVVDTDRTDGARFTLSSRRILHVRPSGNAPELRCYVEAEDRRVAEGLLAESLEELRRQVAAGPPRSAS